MNTYLLTWNPEKWHWHDLAQCVARIEQGEEVPYRWSFVRKEAQIGDRIFMLKQGHEPRGVMASGRVAGEPMEDSHYDPDKAAQGATSRYIAIVFEQIVAPTAEKILSTAFLQQKIRDAPADFKPQGSGSLMTADAAQNLRLLWKKHLQQSAVDFEYAAFEGKTQRYFILHRRREAHLREAKIQKIKQINNGKLRCQVPGCGFDFEAAYGSVGEGYAQVHHLKPLAKSGESNLTTLNDLMVVCANCHAIIHRGGECRDTQSLIKSN